jgi:hypothetical protein
VRGTLDRLSDFWVWHIVRRLERGDDLWLPARALAWLHEVTQR